MKLETWMTLTPGEEIVAEVAGVPHFRTVSERDGKIGWEDGDMIWHERGHYRMEKWEKVPTKQH